MDCRAVRQRLMAVVAPPLNAAEQAVVDEHLAGCEGCRRAVQIDQALNRALGELPRTAAPASLKERIAARSRGAAATEVAGLAAVGAARPSRRRGGSMSVWSAALLGACVAAGVVLTLTRPGVFGPPAGAVAELVREAVNDHLRIVGSVHPVEIESGGIHQVKPWFTGRLEFAPRVAFSGDVDFALLGGSVGYFRDRRAAVFSFKRRLHTITLLVVPHAGLAWPDDHPRSVGPLSVTAETSRGFSLLFWRTGDLGYVLISDVNANDLELLAARLDRE